MSLARPSWVREDYSPVSHTHEAAAFYYSPPSLPPTGCWVPQTILLQGWRNELLFSILCFFLMAEIACRQCFTFFHLQSFELGTYIDPFAWTWALPERASPLLSINLTLMSHAEAWVCVGGIRAHGAESVIHHHNGCKYSASSRLMLLSSDREDVTPSSVFGSLCKLRWQWLIKSTLVFLLSNNSMICSLFHDLMSWPRLLIAF